MQQERDGVVRWSAWLGINMEMFIKVFFWVGLVGCVLRLLLISVRKYPHETTETLGGDLVKFIENAIFVVLAAVLLWGAR